MKRGRKPVNNSTSLNVDEVVKDISVVDNDILELNFNEEDYNNRMDDYEDDESDCNVVTCKNESDYEKKTNNTEEFVSKNVNGNFVVDTKSKIFKMEENKTYKELCWWCCHPIPNGNKAINLPFNITKAGLFQSRGYFCSFNCCKSYSKVFYGIKSLWRVAFMYKKIFGCYKFITFAPPKELLLSFGGTQTINEWRSNFDLLDKFHIYTFPMIYVPLEVEQIHIDEYNIKQIQKQTSLSRKEVVKKYSKVKRLDTNQKRGDTLCNGSNNNIMDIIKSVSDLGTT